MKKSYLFYLKCTYTHIYKYGRSSLSLFNRFFKDKIFQHHLSYIQINTLGTNTKLPHSHSLVWCLFVVLRIYIYFNNFTVNDPVLGTLMFLKIKGGQENWCKFSTFIFLVISILFLLETDTSKAISYNVKIITFVT
jgi:hypothetical protein